MTYPEQPIPSIADPGAQSFHSNDTLVASGSMVFSGFGPKEISVIVNVTEAPSGTLPTLVFTIQEVDPGDKETPFGPVATTDSITGTGIYMATLRSTTGGTVLVSWTLGGTDDPTFTGVYTTITSKVGTPTTDTGSVSVDISTSSAGSVNQGTPAAASDGWPVKITDGTFTAAVKDANTPVSNSDPALVVGISQNTTVHADITANSAGLALDSTLSTSLGSIYTRQSNGDQRTQLVDGDLNTAVIMPASTTPDASDPALVVTVSPNTAPVPITGSITATNPSVSTIGDPVPASATYVGALDSVTGDLLPLVIDVGGGLRVSATNPSVSTTGDPAPASATFIGALDSLTGNMMPVVVDAGAVRVVGSLPDGDPLGTTNVLPVAGSDGFNVHVLQTTVDGRLVVTDGGDPITVDGAVANGDPVLTTKPVLVSGSDGVNAHTIQTTEDGRLVVTDGGDALTVDGAIAEGDPIGTTKPVLVGGTDGVNAYMLRTHPDGVLAVAGAGSAGVPYGGVLTVQGDPSGEPIPITGDITASNPSVSTTGAPIPSSATLIGGEDPDGNLTQASISNGRLLVDAQTASDQNGAILAGDHEFIGIESQGSVGVVIAAGDLVGTLVPYLRVAGSLYPTVFIEPITGKTYSSLSSFATERTFGIATIPGASGAIVSADVYTSGSVGVTFATYGTYPTLGVREVAGQGVAGTPAGGVLTVQGDPTGEAVPVSVADEIATAALVGVNDVVQIALENHGSVGFKLDVGTLEGTLTAEQSLDGGSTWASAFFFSYATGDQPGRKVTSFTPNFMMGSSEPATRGLAVLPGASHVRVRVSSYTAGSANGHLRAVAASAPTVNFTAGVDGQARPVETVQIGGTPEGVSLQTARVWNVGGVSTEYAFGVSLRKTGASGSTEAGTASDPLRVDPTGTTPQPVEGGKQDANNSSSTPLGLSGTFTGGWSSCVGYDVIWLYVYSDVVSSENGIHIDWALDGDGTLEAADQPQGYTYVATEQWASYPFRIRAPYFRIRYETGDAQASFGLVTVLKIAPPDSTVLPNESLMQGALAPEQPRASLVAGIDDTSTARVLATDGSGNTIVTGKGAAGVPDSGVLTVQGTALGTALPVSTTQLPAALVGSRLDTNVGAWLGSTAPTVGQKAMANSLPVAIASDQSNLPIRALTNTDVVSSEVTKWIGSTAPTVGQKTSANSLPVTISSDQSAVAVSATQLPSALVGGRLDANVGAWLGSTAPSVGQKAMASSVPVVIASDQTAVSIRALTNADVVSSEVTKWIGSTAPTVGQKTMANSLPVAIASDQASIPVSFSATNTSDTAVLGALDAAVTVALAGKEGCTWTKAAGAMSASVTAELSFDNGTTWYTAYFRNADATGSSRVVNGLNTSASAVAYEILVLGGATHARLRVSAYTSGSSTFTIYATTATSVHNESVLQTSGTDTTTWVTQIGAPTASAGVKPVRSFDTDSGAGTEHTLGVSLRKTASGGSVEAGTSTDPLRVDPTGTTTQPVSSTQLPGALVGSRLDVNTGAWLGSTAPTVGQKTSANSIPITNASDQMAVDRAAMTAGSQQGYPVIGQSSGVGRILRLSRFGHNQPSNATVQAADPIEGTTVNSWLWTQSVTTMTIAQTTGVLTLNNNSTTANTTSAIITSNRQYHFLNEQPLMCTFTAAANQTTNSVIEMGFGAPSGVTAIVPTGAFFRLSSSLQVRVATSFNGTENVSAVLATLVSGNYYLFRIFCEDLGVRFVVEDSAGVPVVDTLLPLGLTVAALASATHLPTFARTYVSGGAAGVAPRLFISHHEVLIYEANASKPYSDQLAGVGRNAQINPTTWAQTAQAAESAPAGGVPANTSSLYSTLGGEFIATVATSSENIRGVFGFQVPSPYTLYITDLTLPQYAVSTVMANTISIHNWFLITNSTTNAPNGATGQRMLLGTFTAAASAAVGTVFSGAPLIYTFKTPLVVQPGKFVILAVKYVSSGNSGAIRGGCLINGYYE